VIKRGYLLLSILILLGFVTSLSLTSVSATPTSDRQSNISTIKVEIEEIEPEERGKKLYKIGQFQQAVEAWQQAAEDYRIRGEIASQARALSNLSLAYQKLGQWQKAQSAIDSSFSLLKAEDSESQVLAQALNTQGTLQLSLGQTEKALESWQEAEKAYNTAGDRHCKL
jgi:tetratricopeptide (TPR) repeat protein